MTLLQTLLIAIVEGLTEFLPVSSTGHMIVVQDMLGVPPGDPFVHAFTFMIQFGAILSVVCLYWRKFFLPPAALPGEDRGVLQRYWQFYRLLFIGTLPAAVVGILMKKTGALAWLLDSVETVAVMLILGGIFMLFCDRIFRNSEKDSPGVKNAFWIGVFQCLSVIPGTSRSLATIAGGMQQKLSRKAAAEFSFFLAVPTMTGATLLELADLCSGDAAWATPHNLMLLLSGGAVAFVVALLAMKGFVSFLTRHGFRFFGIYRMIAGAAILVWLYTGHSLEMVD